MASELRLLLFASLAGLLLIAGCSGSAEIPGREVILERTGCYGSCPDYTTTLYGSGRVDFSGGGYVVADVEEDTSVSDFAVSRIFEIADSVRFLDLPSSIDKHCVSSATDLPGTRLTMKIGEKSHTVREKKCRTLRSVLPHYARFVVVDGSRVRADSVFQSDSLSAWIREHEDRFIRETYLDLVNRDDTGPPLSSSGEPEEILARDSIARDYLARFHRLANAVDSLTGAGEWAEKNSR